MTLFDGLITSKMRVRILMRLFLNPGRQAYIRELADEMQASPAQVSDELKHLASSGLLLAERSGRSVNYSANDKHPLYPELHSMVQKALGMDQILESIISRLGDLQMALLLDDYAEGKDTGLIDLVLVGDIDRGSLDDLVRKTEKYIHRRIRTLVLSEHEYAGFKGTIANRPQLVLWAGNGGVHKQARKK